MTLVVVAEGRPVPKGSLRRGRGRSLYFPPNVREWENKVRAAAVRAMRDAGAPLIEARCRVNARFYLAPTKNGRLRADLDKLVRGVLDAMTGVVYNDDEQVVGLLATKLAVEPKGIERAELSITVDHAEGR